MHVKTLQDLVELLERPVPSPPETPTPDDLEPWRERIDALDRAILLMLNQRAICANAIGQLKKKMGMPVYVPSREDEVLHNVTTANSGPLDEAAVRRLFERVIDETRSLERHLYQDETDMR
jgi:chorismate mutase